MSTATSVLGGKLLHLRLLERGGFPVPRSWTPDEIGVELLTDPGPFIVRSSAADEDGLQRTGAGVYESRLGVRGPELARAIADVRARYRDGAVVIQRDLSAAMQYSGVAYTNLDGRALIALGRGNHIHDIVAGKQAETEVSLNLDLVEALSADEVGVLALRGRPTPTPLLRRLRSLLTRVEVHFGCPMDVEFAVVDGELILLQARPLPNLTDAALREHERRRVQRALAPSCAFGMREVVLGTGNLREILGGDRATRLSASIFDRIFSGNGRDKLGALQLGRRELGYAQGPELHPWVVYLGGKVYYNFFADALLLRPQGLSIDSLVEVIRHLYIPMCRARPELLHYPDLGLYAQFPAQAEAVGLPGEPFAVVARTLRAQMASLELPSQPPRRRQAAPATSPRACLERLDEAVDAVCTGSGRTYVKATRMGFFVLEWLRTEIEQLADTEPAHHRKVCRRYGTTDSRALRDAIAFEQSIPSFETPVDDDYAYLGSFELTLPRARPPARQYRTAPRLPSEHLQEVVVETRRMLEIREKTKFVLMRDYDHLRQLVEQLGRLTDVGADIHLLDLDDLPLLLDEPVLAAYRLAMAHRATGKALFGEPLFDADLAAPTPRPSSQQPRLIFGTLPDTTLRFELGRDAYVCAAVDQTLVLGADIRLILVADNIRPGSHLFTLLSDYGLPVIAVASAQLRDLPATLDVIMHEDHVELRAPQSSSSP